MNLKGNFYSLLMAMCIGGIITMEITRTFSCKAGHELAFLQAQTLLLGI